MAQLTPREYQVAMLVARGLTNKETAHQLEVSCGTVKLHMHSIMQKLGARSRYAMIFRLRFTSAEISRRALPSKFGDVVNSGNERHL
jgi:DNA-binding NarL/FixJ family response regulator